MLIQYAPDETKAAVALARKHDIPLDRSLNKVLATTPAEVGAWLLQEWQMEPQICEAVRYQNDLNLAPTPNLSVSGSLANTCVALRKFGYLATMVSAPWTATSGATLA